MSVDPRRLSSFGQRPDQREDVGDADSATFRADVEQLDRLMSDAVAYMEIEDDAGGFSCGTCTYADTEEAQCENPKVLAPVSPKHGCCNLFFPADGEPVLSRESSAQVEEEIEEGEG